jgi:hypothetical protein
MKEEELFDFFHASEAKDPSKRAGSKNLYKESINSIFNKFYSYIDSVF